MCNAPIQCSHDKKNHVSEFSEHIYDIFGAKFVCESIALLMLTFIGKYTIVGIPKKNHINTLWWCQSYYSQKQTRFKHIKTLTEILNIEIIRFAAGDKGHVSMMGRRIFKVYRRFYYWWREMFSWMVISYSFWE